ncbi:MAG: hypothetical protein ACRYFU_06375 [Janthinobacterium lividum]
MRNAAFDVVKSRSALQALLLLSAMAMAGTAKAQDPLSAGQNAGQDAGQDGGGAGAHRGQFAGMQRVGGEVTAVNGSTLTVKAEDGHAMQIVTTENTRVMKDRGPVKVSDLHPGDGLMAFGNLDAPNHTLHAAMVMAEDAAQIKAMRDNLGKTYIAGRVTAVDLDNAKMTVERGDHTAQTIGFDETTSFKRAVRGERSGGNGGSGGAGGNTGAAGNGGGRGGFGGGMGMMADGGAAMERAFASGESITLADIKVGDNIVGTGSVKAGVFVPVHLIDSPPRPHRQPNGGGDGGSGAAPPANPGTGSR